jgi:DNA-binding NarL/FixJ family response regulator
MTDVAQLDRSLTSGVAPAGQLRLLIVDDDARVCAALERLLATVAGVRVITSASSAPAALEAHRRVPADAALIDVQLPTPDEGLALIEKLTAHGRAVVATSVNGGLRSRALERGAVAFVEKSPDLEPLLAAIASARDQPSSALNGT